MQPGHCGSFKVLQSDKQFQQEPWCDTADKLWDSYLGEGVPAAQRCHQLHGGQRGPVCDRL